MPSELKSCEIDLGTQVRLARASELARFGKLEQSVELLLQRRLSEMLPEELDLLARILVKLGSHSDARQIWEQASAMAPENPKYPECLTALSAAERHTRYWMYALAGFASVMMIGAVIGFATHRWSTRKAPIPIVATKASPPVSPRPTTPAPQKPASPTTPRTR